MFSRCSHIRTAALLLVFMAIAASRADAAPKLRLSPNRIADQTQYAFSAVTLDAFGGTPPYFWSIAAGSLPPGWTMSPSAPPSATAELSGIPTQSGAFSFTVLLTDSGTPAPDSDSVAYSFAITPSACTFVSGNTGAISFGNGAIDPFIPGQIYGYVTSPVQFTCASNKAYTIAVSPSINGTLTGPGAISYTLGVAPSGTYVLGQPVDLFLPPGVGGSVITQANYQNAPAGLYQDGTQTTITISWTAPAGFITATLPVNSLSANVSNVCQVSGSPAMNFGSTLDADANAGGVAAVVTPPVIYCTMSDSVTISDDKGLWESGAQPRLRSGGNYINYNYTYSTPLSGAGVTTDIGGGAGGLTLSASIPAGALDNAPSGTYTDTVTMTIVY